MSNRSSERGRADSAPMKSEDSRLRVRVGPGRRLSPSERRAQILQVAEAQLGQRPWSELSVREVARAADVTDNLVYHYFSNKETLFLEAFQRRSAELLAACRPSAGGSLFAQFEVCTRGYLDFVEANRPTFVNLVRGPGADERVVAQVCEETRQAIVAFFLEALGLSGREVPATRLALCGYLGFVEAATLRWLAGGSVERSSLERIIFESAGAVLISALELDRALPEGVSTEVFRQAYRRHFRLTP